MKLFEEFWQNQPNTIIGVIVATLVLIGIYVSLLNTFK